MPPPLENPGPFSVASTTRSVTSSEGLLTQLTDIEMVINGSLDRMLKKRLTLGTNDPGTSRNPATLKRHSSILMQILGDLSALGLGS